MGNEVVFKSMNLTRRMIWCNQWSAIKTLLHKTWWKGRWFYLDPSPKPSDGDDDAADEDDHEKEERENDFFKGDAWWWNDDDDEDERITTTYDDDDGDNNDYVDDDVLMNVISIMMMMMMLVMMEWTTGRMSIPSCHWVQCFFCRGRQRSKRTSNETECARVVNL